MMIGSEDGVADNLLVLLAGKRDCTFFCIISWLKLYRSHISPT